MQKLSVLMTLMLFFSVGCTQMQTQTVPENFFTHSNTLTEHRILVKKFDVQQNTSGQFELCSKIGVWQCKTITKKTNINPSIVVSAVVKNTSISDEKEVKQPEISSWEIQVGAYKTKSGIARAVNILSLMNVSYVQKIKDGLTIIRVTGYLTKEEALKDRSNFIKSFNKPFVLKSNQ